MSRASCKTSKAYLNTFTAFRNTLKIAVHRPYHSKDGSENSETESCILKIKQKMIELKKI